MVLLIVKLQLLPSHFWFLMFVSQAHRELIILAEISEHDYRKVTEVLLIKRPRRSVSRTQGFPGYCISGNNCKWGNFTII